MSIKRFPLRETMDNATASPDTDAASRRRSGRVSKAPAKFSQEPVAAKRKRSGDDRDDDEDDDVENELPEADEDISDATDDQEPAVRRPRQRSKRPPKSSAARKPAVKKPKTNGVAPDSLNKATNLPSRPKKTVAISSFAKPGDDDLYGKIRLLRASVMPSHALTNAHSRRISFRALCRRRRRRMASQLPFGRRARGQGSRQLRASVLRMRLADH